MAIRAITAWLMFIWVAYVPFACKQSANHVPASDQEVPTDFSDFYLKFHTDSVYQMTHILFPLDGRPASDTGRYADDAFTWDKSSWKLHNFEHFDPDRYHVRRKVTDSTLVTEFILEQASGIGIKRRFARFGEDWYLIYYDAMSRGE